MSRSERIEHIIQQRKPLVEKISSVTTNLYTLTSRIKTLETFKEKLINEIEDSSIQKNLHEVNFDEVQQKINAILPNLGKLKHRFDRATLNIGVVGMARQGKSRFLQSLTGLTTEEIPDSNMGFCTGVQSAICHQENITTSGLVWFYSPQDLFNEVILPYYDTLNLAPKPDNIYEFAQSNLPTLSDESEVNKATYQHLKDYHDHFEDYQKWFQVNSNPYSIQKEEIREFVSQISSDGKVKYYNYLPVKKVEIICSFPKSDLGKIVLIDTPGIGDTKLNDQDIMLKTVGEDIDAVIFIKKPVDNSQLDKNDQLLYDTAKSALKELPLNLWSFMVLNKTDYEHGNIRQCEALKTNIDSKKMFQKSLVINCTKTEEVNLVLEEVLNYLDDNIIELDSMYAKSCQNEIDKIHQSLNRELEKAKNIFNSENDENYQEIFELYTDLFGDKNSGWWSDITLELEELRTELWNQRQIPNNQLNDCVQNIFRDCLENKGILSENNVDQEIHKQIMKTGSKTTYSDLRDDLRLWISHKFLFLDEPLQETIKSVKNQVATVLKKTGKLDCLSEAESTEYFYDVAKCIPEKYQELRSAFEIMANFQLSYRGLILPRIRKHLDELTNIKAGVNTNNSQKSSILSVDENTTVEEIRCALEISYDKAIHKIKDELEQLLSEPNEAKYSIVEEFIDNILRKKGIDNQWRKFLINYRGKIWIDDFGQQEKYLQNKKEWREKTDLLNQSNNKQLFCFIENNINI